MISDSVKKNENQWPNNKEIIKEYLDTFRSSKQSQTTRKSCLNYFFGRRDKDGDFMIFKKDIKTKQRVKCEKREGKYQYGKNDDIYEAKYFGYKGHVFNIGKKNLLKYRDYLNHLETISLSTKKTKWTILKSFLTFCEDCYEEEYKIFFNFPHKRDWNKIHKEPESNADVFLTIKEIKMIIEYLKQTNFKYYLIFRLFAESGPRKGGVINIDYDKIYLKERYLKTIEKNGRVVYYFSEELRDYLNVYLKERELIKTETKALFLSAHLKRFNIRGFNLFLKKITGKLGIEKNVTCHVFRRSLNLLRFEMGCPEEIRKILLNHSVPGVNFNNYVKKGLDYKKFLTYFDTWNPYTATKVNF